MDITGGLAKEIAALPAELQPIINGLLQRIDSLEAQIARDANAIADKVIEALAPRVDEAVKAVNTMTITVGCAADLAIRTIQRVDGMSVAVKLGPDPSKGD
jgi:hypothetical protein